MCKIWVKARRRHETEHAEGGQGKQNQKKVAPWYDESEIWKEKWFGIGLEGVWNSQRCKNGVTATEIRYECVLCTVLWSYYMSSNNTMNMVYHHRYEDDHFSYGNVISCLDEEVWGEDFDFFANLHSPKGVVKWRKWRKTEAKLEENGHHRFTITSYPNCTKFSSNQLALCIEMSETNTIIGCCWQDVQESLFWL